MMKTSSEKGVIVIIAFLTLGILLLLGTYFLSFAITESKISQSQEIATKTYYLAEAGINEAIWKLKNEWAEDFVRCVNYLEASCGDETCQNWSATTTISTDDLMPHGSIVVTMQNSACARGQIVSVGTINLAEGRTAQRIVKTGVFKAIGGPIEGIAVFSGGEGKHDELKIKSSTINIYEGHLFSNRNVKIEKKSEAIVEDKILAVREFKESADSTATALAICAENICHTTSTCACWDPGEFKECQENKCPVNPIPMPMVDFNSKDTSSYKERALAAENNGHCRVFCQKKDQDPYQCSEKCVFSWSEMDDLLWQIEEEGTLTLDNDITYVEGSIWLRGGRSLIVNGVLVAEKNIEIGKKYFWEKEHEKQEGNSQLTINNDNKATKASGLLSKGKIEFGEYASFPNATTTGLLYANKEMKLKKMPDSLMLEGGIIAKKIKFENLQQNLNVYLNETIVANTLGNPAFSPVITIEHWEEAY